MDLGLKGKVALVTGGSRGIGRHISLSLGREGCKLAIAARTAQQVTAAVDDMRKLGYAAMGTTGDVMVAEECNRIYDATIAAYGHVDILINNAGSARGTRNFETTTDQDWLDMWNLNVMAAVRMTRLALPGMKERRWGRIINISSIWGREYGGLSAYMPSKAALIAHSKHLATEMAQYGVLVNCVAPGSIMFPGGAWDRFTRNNPPEVVEDFVKHQFPMGKWGWPEPIGEMVAFLCSDRADLMTGTCINIDGGQSRSMI